MKVEIIDLGKDGEGIAKYEGKTVFVPFCLPGETVDVCALKEKDKIVFAKKNNIIKKCNFRKDAPCPYFEKCGGCDLQHLGYLKQLDFKRNLVKNTLNKIAEISCTVQNCISCANEFAYRNKIAIPVTFENGKNVIGLYEKNSHTIVEIERCIITKQFNEKLFSILREYLEKYPNKNLSHFVARVIDGSLLLTAVASTKKVDGLEFLASLLQKEFSSFGLNLNFNTNNVQILSNNFSHVAGEKSLKANVLGKSFEVGSGSFYQVNDDVLQKLYSYVLNKSYGKNCVDAYSGAGLLSALLAEKFEKVISVEIVLEATKNAKLLMQKNNIKNVEVICGKSENELPKIMKENKVDCLVLDPPRSGCDKALLEAILNSRIAQIIYVACSPQTLARDLKILKTNYEIEEITPFDMFPQTKHVETVAVLKIKQS